MHKLKVFYLLLLLILLSSCSGGRRLLDRSFQESAAFRGAFSGLLIFDPEKQEVLYEHNGEKYFTPASNIKLFTFYTGLKVLGDTIPHLKYFIENDTLVFAGTGDPSFLHPELPLSPAFDFLKQAPYHLAYAPLENKIPALGPGWAWDDYNAYYSAEISAFPIYGNLAVFDFSEGEMIPRVAPGLFEDSLQFAPGQSAGRLKRLREKNIFLASTTPNDKQRQQKVPFITSEEVVVRLLSDTLDRPISIFRGQPGRPFLKLSSEALTDTIYKFMLQESDNQIAEQILLMASQQLSDTLNSSIAIDHMQQQFLKDLPDRVVWVDGSGLSRYNLVTPRSMVRLLEKIRQEVPDEKLFDLLPSGGQTGTLKNRLAAEEPFIFAKTGSLSNNHSLSGFLKTKKGKILIFSFMNSNFTAPSAELRREMDRLLFEVRDRF